MAKQLNFHVRPLVPGNMSMKLCKPQRDEFRLPNLNKEILEVKKRIQLSEGQRKALFEEIADESKRDADEILRLKQEIAKVQVSIYEEKNNVLLGLLPAVRSTPATVSSAPCKRVTRASGLTRVPSSHFATKRSQTALSTSQGRRGSDASNTVKKLLASVVGNTAQQKSLKDIAEYLDLQRIDKNKQLDLLSYKYKQKETKLKKLAEQYQNLLIKKDATQMVESDDINTNNMILAKDYRNRINAIHVQIKEAEHVRARYKDIRWKMQEDAAKFDSKMAHIELDLKAQEVEINKVKQVNKEALKLRSEARTALQKEERQVLAANAGREKQSLEGKRLVEARQCDLAHLEKYFYQRKPLRLQTQLEINPEEGEAVLVSDMEQPITPEQQLKDDIDVLNEATGSSCIEEVLTKVKGQTTTQVRLMTLRKTKEKIKSGKQKMFDRTMYELEKLKFADDKCNQQNQDDVDEIKVKLKSEDERLKKTRETIAHFNGIVSKIVDKLLNTYMCMYQEEDPNIDQTSSVELIRKINVGIENLQIAKGINHGDGGKSTTIEALLEEMGENEGNWLPGPYNDVIRRTPLPNSSAPTPIPSQSVAGGSEDEDELPTRSYLKRQAQLVVDAKNKRKTMRFPIPKSK